MSRFSFRSAAVVAAIAATPIAARFYSAHPSAGSEPAAAVQQSTRTPGLPAGRTSSAQITSPTASADSPNAADVRNASAAAQDAGKAALAGAVCNFLTEYAQFDANRAGPTNLNLKPLPCVPGPKGSSAPHLRILLAFVPDPARTHLELRFDRAIDDIQDAIRERGWQFDSSWIPWDNRRHPEPDRFGERLLDQAARRSRENTAGAVLFRPSGASTTSQDSPLVVFIVGDTPTGGINAKQFHSAMQMWNALRPSAISPEELNLLGPSFSGSVQSLIHLLPTELNNFATSSADPCRGVSVRVASGSISSSHQLLSLAEPAPGSCKPAEVISFAVDSGYQSEMLRAYLHEKNPKERVAELVEEESAFGSSLVAAVKGESQTEPDTPNRLQDSDGLQPYLLLHFPREISRLREAYEANAIIGFSSSGDSPRSELRFETGEEHRGSDTVPAFSGTQQTLSMESQMASIAATLNQERVGTALLSATDVFDEIFVARYLQQHAPQVTIIIKDADLLFLRRGADAAIQNAYVATPWPLIPQNQFWTSAEHRPELASRNPEIAIHESQNDEGFHAAALHLLPCTPGPECTGAPAEYRSPLAGPDEFRHRPPLWLSIIGRGHYAPVALIDSDLKTLGAPATANGWIPRKAPDTNEPMLPRSLAVLPDAAARAPQVSANNPPSTTAQDQLNSFPAGVSTTVPLQTKLLIAVIAALLLWHGLACAFSRLDRRFAWSYALADAAQHGHRLWVQAALSFSAVIALRILQVPEVNGFTLKSFGLSAAIWFLQLVAVTLATWSLRRWRISSKPQQNPVDAWVFTAIAGATLLVLTALVDISLWACLEPPASVPTERVFFLYRSALMTPGISPSLSVLLLVTALAFWGHSYFARWAFFGHRIPDLPRQHAQDLSCPSPDSLAPVTNLFCNREPSRRFPKNRRTNLWISLGSLLLVISFLGISGSLGPTSLENGRFDIVARLLTILLASVIVNDVAVAVLGWSLLHQYCLLPLKRSPLRWGFTWIKGFSWRRLWTSSYVLSPDLVFDYLSRILQTARRNWDRDPSLIAAHQELLNEYHGTGKKDEAWSAKVAVSLVKLHSLLAARADDLLGRLKDLWAEDRGPLTGNEEQRGHELQYPIAKLEGDDRIPALDRMAAEEFVALLYLGYIRMVLIQIRNRILTALICYVLLVWALTSYSWTNHHAIIVSLSALLALLSVAVIYIYSGMHRDDILSRTTETSPGKLDSEFFEKTIPTLGIPLLSLIATQFPEFSDLIFSFIEPGLRGH